MRKTIDLTEPDMKAITEYKQRNGFKNFSEAVRSMIRDNSACSCGADADAVTDVDDGNFALLADAIKIMDEKIDILVNHTAPRSAGEVKK